MSFDNFDGDGRKGADGPPAWDPSHDQFVVPDDISELDADIRSYHRECRAARRRAWIEKLTLHNRFGFTLPIVVTVLVLVAAYTVVMLVVASPRPQIAGRANLASPSAAVGEIGGLLPDVTLHRANGNGPLRDLRPAVLFLTPAGCDCNEAVRSVATAAEHNRLRIALIGKDRPPAPAGISSGLTILASEPTGKLLNTFNVKDSAPVAVLVRPNGLVNDVLHDIPSPADLDDAVEELVRPGG